MYQLYVWLLMAVFYLPKGGAGVPTAEARISRTAARQDSCHVITEYIGTQKVLEGMICSGKREGIWQVWAVNGRLKDSAMYMAGERTDTSTGVHPLKGVLDFRGHPKVFYKDSTYECRVQVNAAHGAHDISGGYAGVADTIYPPLFYFGADMGARDAYRYYFIPKAAGKYRLLISLAGEAAKAMGNAAFYEQEVEVRKK